MLDEKKMLTQLRQDRKVLWIAVTCGALAALLLFFYLRGQKAPFGNPMPIAVAKVDLAAGHVLKPDDIAIVERPSAFVTGDNIIEEKAKYIWNRPLAVQIQQGQPLLWSFINSAPERNEVSERLNKDYNDRGVTITVDEVKGIAGHLTANDRVDVLGTFTIPGRTPNAAPEFKTKTLLQCVSVLAVGPAQSGQQSFGVPTSVTLKVSPDEAALLSFAESVGQLRLILRNPEDLKLDNEVAAIDFKNIFDKPTVSNQRLPSITIINGATDKLR